MARVAAVPAFCGEWNHLTLARVFVVDVVADDQIRMNALIFMNGFSFLLDIGNITEPNLTDFGDT